MSLNGVAELSYFSGVVFSFPTPAASVVEWSDAEFINLCCCLLRCNPVQPHLFIHWRMCTLVHHGILKVCLLLPQLSSLWPLSKLTVFHIILLSFKCNAITVEADRMQFSKDLVSFPSLPGRLMCSDDPCLFFLLSCCKKCKKPEFLCNLFGLAFGVCCRLGRWTRQLGRSCLYHLCFKCLHLFSQHFLFRQLFTKMLYRCFPEMEVTELKPLYPKQAKPGWNINDVWESLQSEVEAVFCPQPFVIYKWHQCRKPPACRECVQGQSWGHSDSWFWEWELGGDGQKGILSLSAGSLDELTVIVTANDLEWHWLPLLYTLLFYPLIKLKNQMRQWFVGCRGWLCPATTSHLLAELLWFARGLPGYQMSVWYDAFDS